MNYKDTLPISSHMYPSTVIQSTGSISEEIRNEIDRFESVHPCIYAIYDLLEFIPDLSTRAQLRDHMMTLEGSFKKNQKIFEI
uniref:DNA_ligase_aden domain-containing protein n=1 Tax=Strongyloides papillosus TaxID=174720 RepID=A0A0N5B2J8_STREA